MTAGRGTPEQKATRAAARGWPIPERSLLRTVLGVPPLAAIIVALAFTALGVLLDILRLGTLGLVFEAGYFTGCVLAVAWVRRRDLFGPMVAPPLLIVVTVPVVVLLVRSPRPGSGIAQKLLVIGAPLINAFPMMAITTTAVLAVGGARMLLQRTGRTRTAHDRTGHTHG